MGKIKIVVGSVLLAVGLMFILGIVLSAKDTVTSPTAQTAGSVTLDLASHSLIDPDALSKAAEIFLRSCTPLTSRYWGDVASAEGSAIKSVSGDSVVVEIKIALKAKTSIPVRDEYGVPDGHVLYYTLRGGIQPGVVASKRVAQALCGMPVDRSGSDVFRPLPDLARLF